MSALDPVFSNHLEQQQWAELAALFEGPDDQPFYITPQAIFPATPTTTTGRLSRTFSGGAPSSMHCQFLDEASPASPSSPSDPSFSRTPSPTPSLLSSPSSPLSSFSSIPSSAKTAAAPVRKGGRKRGSNIQCDEALIMRLLPMSTKCFNDEIRNLRLNSDEVKKLKFARRRIKNAKAAQKRRSKLSTNLQDLQSEVDRLTGELQKAHAEIARLKRVAQVH